MPVIARTPDILLTTDQVTAANELKDAVEGDAIRAVAVLGVILKTTECATCTDFWWGVLGAVTHEVLVQITKERGLASAPLQHHAPSGGGTTH